MAHRAEAEPDAATVLRRWDAERGTFPRRGQGGAKDLDLAASIALSLSSPPMTPPSRRLFAILGRLPHELARADLPALMPGEGDAAATALARTGLAPPTGERLRLLAPVRAHAAEQALADPDAALADHFGSLADALPYRLENAADRAAELRARAELANIEAVLPRSATPASGSISGWRWIRVGDARLTLGSLTLAESTYRHGQGIFSYLASREPGNAQWQHDLIVSYVKLAETAATGPEPMAAARYYGDALPVARALSASGRLAPADSWMVQDLEQRIAAASANAGPPP